MKLVVIIFAFIALTKANSMTADFQSCSLECTNDNAEFNPTSEHASKSRLNLIQGKSGPRGMKGDRGQQGIKGASHLTSILHLKKQLVNLTDDLGNCARETNELRDDLRNSARETNELRTTVENLTDDLRNSTRETNELVTTVEILTVEFQQHQVEFQQHQVEFQQLQVEFQQLQLRITFLEKCNKPTAITDGSFTPDQTTYEHNQTIQLLCTDTTTHTATGSSTSTCINGDFVPVIDFKCMNLCGLFSDIADEQITASSVRGDHPSWGPQQGRLFSTSGNRGWLAKTTKGEWIQVDFGTDVDVTGIRTQGGYQYDRWVTSYSVSFQRGTDKSFSNIEDKSGKTVIFDGNADQNTVVAHIFDGPVSARYIRIYPVTYHAFPVMRFDVLTC